MTDTVSTPETTDAAPEAVATKEFVEYVGTEPHGVEFVDKRAISPRQAKAGWDIKISKDLVWTKNRHGRMLLAVDEIPAEVLPLLLEDASFRVVAD